MIITTSEILKARKVIVFQHFSFYGELKFHAQLVEHEKICKTLGPSNHVSISVYTCIYFDDYS